MHAEILVQGIVQGVGFRPFIYRIAVKNNLVGYVRNLGDAGVRIVVEGEESKISSFLEMLKNEKPPLAVINDLTLKRKNDTGSYDSFVIIKSTEEKTISGSIIPPDVAICSECLKELRYPKDRRYEYFFITCTDCGPRYTTIRKLPYDKPNTTMDEFPMCENCRAEYIEPSDRRFHAQTIACPKCGPKVWLASKNGQKIESEDPVRDAGKLLEEGYILAVKGNGGFHIASSTLLSEPLDRLRITKYRGQKPFAIMARDLASVKSFAKTTQEEITLLTSYIRPIVLLEKSDDYYLSDLISPGLHNLGVMLPYSGLHSMLFDKVKEPAFVMTSANPPSEPIVTENDAALKELGPIVDYILYHDRKIAQRCDDSVVRLIGKTPGIIRRSRGYSPAPIYLGESTPKCSLGVGAELNVTSCVISNNKAFFSQHIGDVETFETYEFLKESTKHLIELTNSKLETIGCDMHPTFNSVKFAKELGEQFKIPIIPVQHHHAHIAALMSEYDIDEVIGLSCDGYGYGADGKAWGGEVLYCNENEWKRIGHLEEHPMVGGDRATKYPVRMVAGILFGAMNIEEWLSTNSKNLPYGESEVGIILKQLANKDYITTTSCGRILDAASSLLGICYERTYEGEPAMRLESVAAKGKNVLDLEPAFNKESIDTTRLFELLMERIGKDSVPDLAYSAQNFISNSLAEYAVEKAKSMGVKTIGFSGGVAYNKQIALSIKKTVESQKLKFLLHKQVPTGDGGISLGQAAVANRMIK